MVWRRSLRASQRPTNVTLDNACVIMRAKGYGEASGWLPQLLPDKSEGPTGGTTRDLPRGTWTDGSIKTLLSETELSEGGELDVENVEVGETYLGTGGLHLWDDTTRLLHGRPTRN